MKKPSAIGCCVFLLSGSALAYEVILVRLLSITRFYHLAFMVLSLALLGYGASGVLLAHFRSRLLKYFEIWFCLFAVFFALGAVGCFQLSQHIPLHPGQWLWSSFEAVFLVLVYLVLSLPFLMAACGVGLAYCAIQYTTSTIYRADLLGAAIGSLSAVLVLWLPDAQALWLPLCGGLAAASVMGFRVNRPIAIGLILIAAAGPVIRFRPAIDLKLSPDKPLSIALSAEGAQKMADIFTPIGRITLMRNTTAPYRFAPGLSLSYTRTVPAQWVAFRDSDSYEPVFFSDMSNKSLAYLDFLPEALAYFIKEPARVLILETYAAEHPARAIDNGASKVDVVMSNPGWRTLRDHFPANVINGSKASELAGLTIQAPRSFLLNSRQTYDLIVMAEPNPSAMQNDHLHTVEAFYLALSKLTSDGVLSVSGPSDLPPRAGLRLLSTAAAALRRSGASAPSEHIAMIRSLRTVHMLVQKTPFRDGEIEQIREFCRLRRFDPIWFPGMKAAEANHWNRLATPMFFHSAVEIFGPEAAGFQKKYKFDVSSVVDDRPFFSHFMKIKTLPELLAIRARGGFGMLSYAEPVLAATLLQALLLSLLVVWLPLRRFKADAHSTHLGIVFFMLGAGFMLVEYAVLEKMSLFLDEPVLAVAVTLAGFLATAGLGSGITSHRQGIQGRRMKTVGITALGVAGILVLYMMVLPFFLDTLLVFSLPLRIFFTLLIIVPLALTMGTPFPLALAELKTNQAQAVPWAWGLNGCGAMVGPILGIVMMLYAGVAVVFWAGICCYGVCCVLLLPARFNA